ncbi:MAG: glycosyltransferase [Chitinophagales bacterium]
MDFSVVIPLYYYANNTATHLADISKALASKYKDFEIIFVIDNSQISKEIAHLIDIQKQLNEVKIVQLNKNYGQHFATLCGFYLAKGKYILSVDEDMSHYIVDVCRNSNYEQADIYFYFYDKDKMYQSTIRKTLSNVYKNMLNYTMSLKPSSTFRIIKADLRDKILNSKHIFWNIDIMLFKHTENINGELIEGFNVTDQHSSYNYKKLFQMAFEIIYEHNTVLMNLLLAFFPTILYYWLFQDTLRTIGVYVIFTLAITSFFNLLKFFTPSTASKIEAALKK